MAWRENYRLWMQFVNEYKNRGGTVTVGSDSGYIYNLYGFGYIQEMELLREAGFSALEVIHAATQAGARTLGHEDQVGTIRVGRKADLVIVNGNPLANLKTPVRHGDAQAERRDRPGRTRGRCRLHRKGRHHLRRSQVARRVARDGREAEGATEHPTRSDEDRDRRRIPVTHMTITCIRTIVLALLLSPAALVAQTPATNEADQRLKALYNAEWDWRQKEFAREPGQVGRGAAADHLPRVDAASQQKRLEYWQKVLADLDRIPLQQLSPEEKLNAQIFRAVLEEQIVDVRYKTLRSAVQRRHVLLDQLHAARRLCHGGRVSPLSRPTARRATILRRADRQHARRPRARLHRAKVSVTGRDRTIEPYLKADETNPLYLPFETLPPSIPSDEQERMRAEARSVIAERIVPAYSKLLDFIRKEYLVKARTTLAAEKLPDGKAYYQAMIRKFTTLDLTAQQIHEIGLGEVARIKGLMQTTMQKTGFRGTLPEFMTFLRTDPQFYAKTPHELLANATYVLKKMDGKLKDTIGFLPRFRHGVLPVPDGARAHLHRRSRRARELHVQHLQPAGATALHAAVAGAARVHAGSQLPGGARARRARAAGVSQGTVFFRLWRGLGPLHRMARRADRHLRDAVRRVRPADVRDLARRAAGRRYRHPS